MREFIGSRTFAGYVMFPPFEPSPHTLQQYPSSLFLLAASTTLASPISPLKTETPSLAAISSTRSDVGPFTASAMFFLPFILSYAASMRETSANTVCALIISAFPFFFI